MSMLRHFTAPAVKICGLKTMVALDAAIEGGAAFIGLVFFEKSPRHLTIAEATALADAARGRVHIVALTVNSDDDALDVIVSAVKPDILQLHGEETPDRVTQIKKRHGRPIIKAMPVAQQSDIIAADAYLDVADIILFDAKPAPGADLPGGNGLTFDWRLLDAARGRFPFMLSGGLTPDNVANAIRLTSAHAVDVSSGVESAPGIKDVGLVRRFLDAAHANPDGRG